MFDLFTYFIYISLLLIVILLTAYKQKNSDGILSFQAITYLRAQHFIALILISLIVGFRYEVGVDWEGYLNYFQTLKIYKGLNSFTLSSEPAFAFINLLVIRLDLGYQWMFFVLAFISWYFLFKSLPKYLIPLLVFFLFVDEYFFWSMNGVRQFAAMSMWVYSIRYILRRNITQYLIIIFLASLFHRSALVLIPLYFIPYFTMNNKYILGIIFITSLLIGSTEDTVVVVEQITNALGQLLPYSRYIGSKLLSANINLELGLGFAFRILVNFAVIMLSNKIINKHPKTSTYFILFFIGAILFNLTYNVLLIGRLNNYFIVLRSVVLAITIWYFYNITRYRAIIVIFLFLYLALFFSAIYNSSNMCSPYRYSF